LPAELFGVIAEFLAGDFKLGSLANLNVANRLIQGATSAVLWTTITLDTIKPGWIQALKIELPDPIWETVETMRTQEEAVRYAKEKFEQCKDMRVLPENRRHVKYVCEAITRRPGLKDLLFTVQQVLDLERR
jgi:hypothetical protein